MRLRPLLVLIFAALLAPPAAAQRRAVDFTADYATFMYAEGASLLEVYLGVGARSIRYGPGPSGQFAADLPVRLTLRPTRVAAPAGAATAPAWEHNGLLRFVVPDTNALAPGQYFLDRVRGAVAPGEYTLEVLLPGDPATGRPEQRLEFDPVVVPAYDVSRSGLSGLTLATAIRPGADADDPFFTHGLSVVPNPNAVFAGDGGPLHFYAEAYGLDAASGQPTYTLLAYVAAADEPRPLPGLQTRAARPARAADVLVGSFDVGDLPSGAYYLRIAALNASNEPLVEQSKRFWVLNPDVEQPLAGGGGMDFEERFFAVMPPEELVLHLAQVQAIATQTELRQIRTLETDEARRTYLAAFWRSRDTDDDPGRNAAREEFGQRLRYIERYGVGGLRSWESDRGRVVLRYGYPSEVDTRPQNQNVAPHEVWVYENIPGQGQALFVFADRAGTSRYELLHSTVIGEITTPNWERLLVR